MSHPKTGDFERQTIANRSLDLDLVAGHAKTLRKRTKFFCFFDPTVGL